MKNFRWWIERVNNLYPNRGLALTYNRGSTGSTYGEEGKDMFFEISLTFIRWTWRLYTAWKRIS